MTSLRSVPVVLLVRARGRGVSDRRPRRGRGRLPRQAVLGARAARARRRTARARLHAPHRRASVPAPHGAIRDAVARGAARRLPRRRRLQDPRGEPDGARDVRRHPGPDRPRFPRSDPLALAASPRRRDRAIVSNARSRPARRTSRRSTPSSGSTAALRNTTNGRSTASRCRTAASAWSATSGTFRRTCRRARGSRPRIVKRTSFSRCSRTSSAIRSRHCATRPRSSARSTSPESERTRTVVEIVQRQVTNLSRLVDDLLDVSRITQGRIELKRRSVQLTEVIGHALEIVDPLFRETQAPRARDRPCAVARERRRRAARAMRRQRAHERGEVHGSRRPDRSRPARGRQRKR